MKGVEEHTCVCILYKLLRCNTQEKWKRKSFKGSMQNKLVLYSNNNSNNNSVLLLLSTSRQLTQIFKRTRVVKRNKILTSRCLLYTMPIIPEWKVWNWNYYVRAFSTGLEMH